MIIATPQDHAYRRVSRSVDPFVRGSVLSHPPLARRAQGYQVSCPRPMSLIFSSTTPTPTATPARHAAPHDGQPRGRRDRVVHGVLVCFVVIAALILHRGASRPWMALSAPLRSQSSPIKADDRALRQLATKSPVPVYPALSLANKVTGVVVATVTIDVSGQVRSVTIVESPDVPTGRSVRDAVSQWVFRPVEVPRAANLITANMIFYFHLSDGRGVVLSSQEMQAMRAAGNMNRRLEAPTVPRVIDEAELGRLRGTNATVVLDIRSRAAHLQRHRDGAVNIPLRELNTRGGTELPRSQLIVIDCFVEQEQSGLCTMAVHVLTSHHFSDIAVLHRKPD